MSNTTTPAMSHRSLRSLDAQQAHEVACLRGTGLPFAEALAHRMARHRARIAWAEVEYEAWVAGNCIGLVQRAMDRPAFRRLLDAAYAADLAERDAHLVLVNAESRAALARDI